MLHRRRAHLSRTVSRGLAVAALTFGVVATTAAGHAAQVESDSLSYFADGNVYPLGGTSAPSKQTLVTSGGGNVASIESYAGSGQAADFPNYDGTQNGPRAVVAMTNTTGFDVLTPLAQGFSFGADIMSDSVSTGTSYDNGNNIFQRGLYGDTAQYKIQIDHGYAMCRVKGDKGAVQITSSHLMPTGSWFRVSCARKVVSTGDKLQLDVTPINADGTLGTMVRSTSAIKKVGRLSYALATPVSIGGKLISATQIHSASDQFNGLIDNPVLNIG